MHQVGVDIVDIQRIQRASERWGDRFLGRVFTPAEREECRGRPSRLASRFAAKEAVMKALGTGRHGASWQEVEVLATPSGAPSVHLHGRAWARAQRLKLGSFSLSISDVKDYAVALVVAEGS